MGAFAFETEIVPSHMDASRGADTASLSKLVEYFAQATWAYGHKLRSEHDITRQQDVEVKLEVSVRAPLRISDGEGPTSATVAIRCARLGTSSYTLEGEIRQGDEVVAQLMDTFVMINPETGRSEPIASDMREAVVSDHAARGIDIQS